MAFNRSSVIRFFSSLSSSSELPKRSTSSSSSSAGAGAGLAGAFAVGFAAGFPPSSLPTRASRESTSAFRSSVTFFNCLFSTSKALSFFTRAMSSLLPEADTKPSTFAGDLFFAEPQPNLLLCRLHRVRPMDDISAHIDAEVAPNGTRSRVLGVCGAQQYSSLFHCPKSLPHHRNDGTRTHVADQFRKEAFLAEVGIVLF